jgi:hypothetical protein
VAHATDYFDEVAAGKSVTFEPDGQVVRLSPAHGRRSRARRRVMRDDSLSEIIGMGRYTGPTDRCIEQ